MSTLWNRLRRVPWGLLLTTIFLSLLGVEVLLRVLPLEGLGRARERWSIATGALEPHPAGLYRIDPAVGWTLAPGFLGRFEGPDFDIEIRANSDGLRDVEIVPSGGDALRVVGLGDSFGFGWGVENHESFFKILEARLQMEGCDTCEVINAAIPGFGTYEALQLLKAIGPGYGPDVVVLAFYEGNDAFNNGESPRQREIRDGYLANAESSGAGGLLRRSLLASLISERLAGVERKRRFSADVERTKQLVTEMEEYLGKMGIPLVLLYISDQDPSHYDRPATLALYDRMLTGVGPDYLRQELTAHAIEEGIPLCTLSKRFEADGTDLRLEDTHFNRDGHALVADELFACLESHELALGPGTITGQPD